MWDGSRGVSSAAGRVGPRGGAGRAAARQAGRAIHLRPSATVGIGEGRSASQVQPPPGSGPRPTSGGPRPAVSERAPADRPPAWSTTALPSVARRRRRLRKGQGRGDGEKASCRAASAGARRHREPRRNRSKNPDHRRPGQRQEIGLAHGETDRAPGCHGASCEKGLPLGKRESEPSLAVGDGLGAEKNAQHRGSTSGPRSASGGQRQAVHEYSRADRPAARFPTTPPGVVQQRRRPIGAEQRRCRPVPVCRHHANLQLAHPSRIEAAAQPRRPLAGGDSDASQSR